MQNLMEINGFRAIMACRGRQSALTRTAFIALLVTLAPWASAQLADATRWHDTLAEIRETFPDVPHLTTRQLADKQSRGDPVLLLDARTAEEFRVSHIDGAVPATTIRAALDAIKADSRQPTVVVYCSVGYRSSRLVSRLQTRGIEDVFNLEGSLFRWANEGRPLSRGDLPAKSVHPYDDDWGELLNAPLRAE